MFSHCYLSHTFSTLVQKPLLGYPKDISFVPYSSKRIKKKKNKENHPICLVIKPFCHFVLYTPKGSIEKFQNCCILIIPDYIFQHIPKFWQLNQFRFYGS